MTNNGFSIPAKTTVMINIEVVNPSFSKGLQNGTVKFMIYGEPGKDLTEFNFTVSYEVLEGKLNLYPNNGIKFKPAIPGTGQARNVTALSTFKQAVLIKAVHSSDPSRVQVKILNPHIIPDKKVEIVQVSFNAHQNKLLDRKQKDSYGSDGDEYSLSNLDILNWKIEEKEWEYLGQLGETDTNAVITIETNLIQNISIEAKGQIIFP